MADVFAPSVRSIHIQGAVLPGGLFAWVELASDGRRVDWLVTSREEPVDWGSDPIPGARTPAAQEAALEARMRLLVLRYGEPGQMAGLCLRPDITGPAKSTWEGGEQRDCNGDGAAPG